MQDRLLTRCRYARERTRDIRLNRTDLTSRAIRLSKAFVPFAHLPLRRLALERPGHVGLDRADLAPSAVPFGVTVVPFGFALFWGALEGAGSVGLDGADVSCWTVFLDVAVDGGGGGGEAHEGNQSVC